MRILLDESLPRPLGLLLTGHTVSTVRDESWTSLTNGALLQQAAVTFDVLLTADQNIEFQQNLATLPLAVIVLVAESNRLESLEPLVPVAIEALKILKTENVGSRPRHELGDRWTYTQHSDPRSGPALDSPHGRLDSAIFDRVEDEHQVTIVRAGDVAGAWNWLGEDVRVECAGYLVAQFS